jgi:hypothetical protein
MAVSNSDTEAAAKDGKADKSIAERLFELAGYRDISATAFMVRSKQPNKCVDKKVYIPLFINGYRTTGMLDKWCGPDSHDSVSF